MLRLTTHWQSSGADQRRRHPVFAAHRSPPLRNAHRHLGPVRSRERRLGEAVRPHQAAKTHRVPLSSPALALLRQRSGGDQRPLCLSRRRPGAAADRRQAYLGCGLPRSRAGGPAAAGQRDGTKVCDKDGKVIEVLKPTVRLHDLRHTYASILASRGQSLPIIGALLGHTQPQTTARYAHLLDDPLRAATEAAADVIASHSN